MIEYEKVSSQIYGLEGQIDTIKENLANRIQDENEMKKLIAVGFGSWIFFQTVINLGGAVGLIPITGIVLPFVSYGSSAMISIFVALGMMYSKDYE